jgi:hypothetical protein
MGRKMLVVCLGLGGCAAGTGTWSVETWGEEYIEDAIPAEVFEDGCSVVFDEFVVVLTGVSLLDGNGAVVGEVPPGRVYDLVQPGPTPLGEVSVRADHYASVEVIIAPTADAEAGTASSAQVDALRDAGASVKVRGSLACDADAITFDWTFDEATTYACEPTDLTIPAGGSDGTQITVHGDHLFYDGLENADAKVRGQTIIDADGDQDGQVTLEELDAVSIPALGFDVGEFSDVLTLRQFVSHLTRTLAHIDGEGECRVAF